MDAQPLRDEGAGRHDHQGDQERPGEPPLPAWLAPGHERSQEDAGREEGGHHPEQRQLQVPGAGQVERQQPGQVEAEEAREVGPVVLRRTAEQHLGEEEQRDDEEEERGDPLRGRERHLVGGAEVDGLRLTAAPAQMGAPPADGPEQRPDAGQQGDQRHHAPQHGVGGGRVAHQRLAGPVVGVGVARAGAFCRGDPGRPGQERGELVDLPRVGDRVRTQSLAGAGVGEVAAIVADEGGEGVRLRRM